ncbi:transcriptional adapter 1-like isoform X2 [Salvelinus fontinalis]|uniref:transcriptional adapter 1-like isoform X2 n=1 Tax=Salvelinus fontinalis TaxID=8038 RepID=UPI00248671EF|nr:transcriptional adapter 1-like isoform X2 [Salvelinus fontinalis]
MSNIHVHNDFLLAILTRCQIIVSTPEGAGSLLCAGSSASKPGKPAKGKNKFSFRQKSCSVCDLLRVQHRFQPQNPLSAAQAFSLQEVGSEEEELRLSAHTLLLPTRGQLEARMMVTAFELGLDNVTEDAVSTMVHAVESHLKDMLTAVVSKRKAYRLRDGHFPYAFGSDVTPPALLEEQPGSLPHCHRLCISSGRPAPSAITRPC